MDVSLDLFGEPLPDEPLPPAIDLDAQPDPEPEPEITPEPVPVLEGQLFLFDPIEPWRHEWNGMPEFVCEDLTPMRSVTVHFASEIDVKLFEQVIGQSVDSGLGMAAGSIWYPELEITRMMDKRYVTKGNA